MRQWLHLPLSEPAVVGTCRGSACSVAERQRPGGQQRIGIRQLTGWRIDSTVGGQQYTFSSRTLAPGAGVCLYSGRDGPPTGGNRIRWTTSYIWNDSGDTAQLKNPQDQVDSDHCWTRDPPYAARGIAQRDDRSALLHTQPGLTPPPPRQHRQ